MDGACCLSDGECVIETEDAGNQEGGEYQGENETCEDITCPEP